MKQNVVNNRSEEDMKVKQGEITAGWAYTQRFLERWFLVNLQSSQFAGYDRVRRII